MLSVDLFKLFLTVIILNKSHKVIAVLNSDTSYITGETNNDKKTDYVYIACRGKTFTLSENTKYSKRDWIRCSRTT